MPSIPGQQEAVRSSKSSTKQRGDAAEDRTLAFLQRAGLTLVARNFKTPGRGGGEIDLIMRDRDATLVFVEVRLRASDQYGGAAASVGWAKRRRLVWAARHFLARFEHLPACRFDVLTWDGDAREPVWLQAAFDAQGFD
jgi:putative endonuclease